MSTFSNDIGREEEDGGGWGGLVPDKEEMAKSETQAPERIYLQWFGVDSADVTPKELANQPSPGDLTWCSDKQFDTDVEYVRADLVKKRRDDGK